MTRKVNPNSLKNLKPRQKEKGTGSVKKSLTLHPKTIAAAQALGEGVYSRGVDRLFAQLPTFLRCKALLETIAADENSPYTEEAEALLFDLEDLEIDRTYDEAIAEGVIKTPSGAYIV